MTVVYRIDAAPSLTDVRSAQQQLAEQAADAMSALLTALHRAYADRLAQYREELDVLTATSGTPFPEVTLTLDGTEVPLAIDDQLYTSLFDLYLFYGPDGVAEVARALQVRGTRDRAPTLSSARRFFVFTRNCLNLVVRESLIRIEQLAAQPLFDQLGKVNRQISAALLGDLKVTLVEGERHGIAIDDDGPVVTVKDPDRYRLDNRDRADLIHRTVSPALRAREQMARLLDDQSTAGMQERADAARAFALAQQQAYQATPFALLILPGLAASAGPAEIEDALGALLIKLGQDVDALGRATVPGRSRIRADLAGLRDADPDKHVSIIENLYLDGPRGMQLGLIETARGRIDDDPGYAAMLHPGTLLQLMSSGAVAPGSFDHSVLHHWLLLLGEETENRTRRRASQQRALSVASACLSLLALAAPPLAPLALIADLSLLAFTIYSLGEQLNALDEAVKTRLPELNAADHESLVAVGTAVAELTAYRGSLSVEAATQLALLPAAQIRAFGILLKAHAYFNDVRTLYQEATRG
ncbi:hypothetical protein ABZ208_37600 [Streptomyces sp. NPDC006208]|uniref:hypothetical protein n=1 Tax=Streptomyces sp. NPDC006208 TaxID=3156734 RepID=UPI0033BA8B0A